MKLQTNYFNLPRIVGYIQDPLSARTVALEQETYKE
jgi:hypothetical protein